MRKETGFYFRSPNTELGQFRDTSEDTVCARCFYPPGPRQYSAQFGITPGTSGGCLGLRAWTDNSTASAAPGASSSFSPDSQRQQIKGTHSVRPLTSPRPAQIAMASPTIVARDNDRKGVRTASPSISSGRDGSNVVDHLAPGVTEHVPSHVPRRNVNDKIITVQPLRKDEMQVRPPPARSANRLC